MVRQVVMLVLEGKIDTKKGGHGTLRVADRIGEPEAHGVGKAATDAGCGGYGESRRDASGSNAVVKGRRAQGDRGHRTGLPGRACNETEARGGGRSRALRNDTR